MSEDKICNTNFLPNDIASRKLMQFLYQAKLLMAIGSQTEYSILAKNERQYIGCGNNSEFLGQTIDQERPSIVLGRREITFTQEIYEY